MNAALELERKKHPSKEVIPAGIFYYQMKDPMVPKSAEEQGEEELLKELRPDGLVNSDPDVLGHLDHTSAKVLLRHRLEEIKTEVSPNLHGLRQRRSLNFCLLIQRGRQSSSKKRFWKEM